MRFCLLHEGKSTFGVNALIETLTSRYVLASLGQLMQYYDAFLVDNYGVLVNSQGKIEEAHEALKMLIKSGKQVVLISNTADNLPEELTDKLKGYGASIDSNHIVTSGSVLPVVLRKRNLIGKTALVIGNKSSEIYVQRASAQAVLLENLDQDFKKIDFVVVGYFFEENLSKTLDMVTNLLRERDIPAMLLNTDERIPWSKTPDPGYR